MLDSVDDREDRGGELPSTIDQLTRVGWFNSRSSDFFPSNGVGSIRATGQIQEEKAEIVHKLTVVQILRRFEGC
jgi:hypothetical protein